MVKTEDAYPDTTERAARLEEEIHHRMNALLPDDYVARAYETAPQQLTSLTGFEEAVHALFGMATEVGELTDIFKKGIYYYHFQPEPPIDKIKEELGDLMWYIALLCKAYGLSLEEVVAANLRKLRARYTDGFDVGEATIRDRTDEVAALQAVGSQPTKMNPRCPLCGRPMEIRDDVALCHYCRTSVGHTIGGTEGK